ncbi:MAG TPA: glycogen debranching N-terminal domain-containing protein [Trebonia sp.]|jgi:glycogen debranching enzyme|nr:glycogen debranching N-terminal domain-containing protein [Trebonia sp.]
MSALDQPWLHELVTVLSAPTVALSDHGGQIRPEGAQGVLHADVRVLSQAVLEVDGVEPTPISGGLLDGARARFVSVPRALGNDDIVDPTVRVERERTVTPGEIRESIRVISFADVGVDASLTLTMAADLAELTEIKSARADGPPVAPHRAGTGLSWEKGSLRAVLSAPGATVELPADAGADIRAGAGRATLRWPVRLTGRDTCEITWRLSVTDPSAVVVAAPADASGGTSANGSAGGSAGRSAGAKARASADDPRLPGLLAQSLADIDALRMAVPQAPGDVFLAAGAPWYFTLFGRDSIWAARLLLPFGWRLAAGTLRALAAFQGRRVDKETAEAPGKIPHELRRNGIYYGTIDATPLWICLLHDAWRWGMPAAEVAALLPNLRAALEWMRDFGDSDGDGLLEYVDESGHGLSNQGWKDSGDSVRFADGTIATAPVALCEVQGYAHEAALRAADLLDAFGTGESGTGESGTGESGRWREWAARLADAFRAAFWVTGHAGRYPALALDADKRPVDSLTSNIGHLLGTGLLSPAEETVVAEQLATADMDSGFGLRTMSDRSGGYNPLSYHCGSVWSHDTAIVIRGLARSGHARLAAPLADGLLAAASAFGWRLPELYSGEARSRAPWPTPYPASCRPQAWSAAASGAIVQALLGLDADVPGGTVTVRPPGVRIGGAGLRLHVDGLIAGDETFSAGVDDSGRAYVQDCGLELDVM